MASESARGRKMNGREEKKGVSGIESAGEGTRDDGRNKKERSV